MGNREGVYRGPPWAPEGFHPPRNRERISMTSASLREKPVRDLARMAKQHGVAGWHAMRKDQLIKALVSKAKKALPSEARRSAARPAKPSGERSKAAVVQPSPAAVAPHAEVARRNAEARERIAKAKNLAPPPE